MKIPIIIIAKTTQSTFAQALEQVLKLKTPNMIPIAITKSWIKEIEKDPIEI